MKKAIIFAFALCFILPYLTSLTLAEEMQAEILRPQPQMAVTSSGELNVKGNEGGSAGAVIVGSTADLVLTIVADMSQMEPGEEIKSIQIIIPTGFTAGDDTVKLVTVGGDEKTFESVVDGNRVIVTLPSLITYTTMVIIEFTVGAPSSPGSPPPFIVGILNDRNNPILYSIDGKDADGKSNNNNSLYLTVVAATKPSPPTDISVTPDPDGENDLIVSWAKSNDPEVSGYLVYRSDLGSDPLADIHSREQTSYTDVNLQPGEYSYTVRSYKTESLKSDTPDSVSAVAPEDTKHPEPPGIQPEIKVVDKGLEISWEASSSPDVVKYIIYRGASINSLSPIDEIDASDLILISYVDENPPAEGIYLYVVGAVDEADQETKSSPTQSRLASATVNPYPNPFTPLSADAIYNEVTFPAAIVEGGEGVFALKIFDLEGDIVIEKEAAEGSIEIKWDGKDSNGEYVNSGIYVYQATMGVAYKIGSIIVAK